MATGFMLYKPFIKLIRNIFRYIMDKYIYAYIEIYANPRDK